MMQAALELPEIPLRSGARVVVAMSGGVDSSVVAALLKAQDYDVIGITLQLYDSGSTRAKAGACCAGADIRDAASVAERLAFPHYVLDYEARFRQSVIDAFADSYVAGETPIPCIQCNDRIKFHDLLAAARDLGAEALATGHYVRRVGGAMHRARDLGRDQSYFLYRTRRADLEFLHFPLGDLDKRETRGLAQSFGLAVADKPDSQDICFVPQGHYSDLVRRLRPGAAEPGEIVDVSGRVIGSHDGVVNFTVGQRKGLGVATGEPLFVVKLDAAARRVVVGPKAALSRRRIKLRAINWLGDGTAPSELRAGVKLRAGHAPVPATIFPQAETVVLDDPQAGIAPGQACVFYDGSRMLGGGWIVSSE